MKIESPEMRDEPAGVCEERTFSSVFRTHARTLRNYLYFRYGNEETAGDIVQEAFVKLWENCASVPPGKARSFLYTVANNASLNVIAHEKVVLRYAQSKPARDSHSEAPDFKMEEAEFGSKLQSAIDGLSEAQRTAFLLNRIEGKKYHEIAEMLGISVKAVEKRISGALASLRKEIDQIR